MTDRPAVRVDGKGTATAEPERATLRLSVSCLRPDAATAVAAADACVRAVTDAARGLDGVQAPVTTGISVRAEEVWTAEGGQRRTGVRVGHGLRVHVVDLSGLGKTLATLLAAGGDDLILDDLAIGVADDVALARRARELAFEDARARAEQLVAMAGRQLGPLLSVEELDTAGAPRPLAARALAAEPLAVAPGSVEATVHVVASWQLA
jgi:uncharacterized protein